MQYAQMPAWWYQYHLWNQRIYMVVPVCYNLTIDRRHALANQNNVRYQHETHPHPLHLRSGQYPGSPKQAVRSLSLPAGRDKDCFPQTKNAVCGLPPEQGKRKINPVLNKSILPSHHNMPAATKQAGKGQWINHIPYK